MGKTVAMAMVGLLILSAVPALLASGLPMAGDLEMAVGGRGDPTGWYTNWFRDADRDGVDDLLEGDVLADLFVDFDGPVTDKDLSRLGRFGEVMYVDPYIHVAAMPNVPSSMFPAIAALPGVVMVEKQLPLYPLLNTSLPAIRGVSSTTYANGAHNLGYDGSGIAVAIFDTGVDNDVHEFLDDQDNNAATNDPKYVAGVDTTPIVGYIETDPEDTDGHGTHVAGIAIGTGYANGTYKGLAPQADLVDVKVLPTVGAGNGVDFLEGLTWCRNNMDEFGIRVLSMSFGTQGTSDGNDSLSRAVNEAVRRDGLIVVAAIGNDGPSNSGIPAPAAADEAITVGAYDDIDTITRADDVIWTGSSRGPRTSDGDGDELDELKPDISAPGVGIWSAWANTLGGLRLMSGTSMAAPHVAGVIALMLDANPDLGPDDVRSILRGTAQARGEAYDTDLSPKYNTGYGWGLVDAYGAVKRAKDLAAGGTIVGPPTIASGTSGSFTARFELTRTEWESTATNVSFNISAPRDWGEPSSIAVSSEEGVTYTTGSTVPVQGLENWTFRAWASFTGPVSDPTLVKPKVTFTTFAPIEIGTYRFYVTPLINGVEGSEDQYSVQVTEGTGGLPDFYLMASDIAFSSETPIAGQFVNIDAVIHNGGSLGSNANVSFFDGPPETGLFIGRSTVSVPSGGVDTATATWLATPGVHAIHVAIDLLDNVEESNENNNVANRTIQVTGFNSPPTANLVVTPTSAGVGFPVLFDGGNSTDIDGIIVLYHYDFGDGNTSGWIPSPNITYTYSTAGLYAASLTVQDNGGARSTNDPQVLVNVMPTTTKARTMFLHNAYRLLFTEPDEAKASTVALPDGFTPIAPGSPFGTVEEMEVGTWTSNAFRKNNTVSGTIKYHIWVNNTGPQAIEVTNFTFNLELNDIVIDRVVVTNVNFIPAGTPTEVVGYSSIPDTGVNVDDALALNIWCAIDGTTGTLEYASKNRGSGVDLTFTTFQGIPPVVDAGENITARVNETVEFIPSASDEDGKVDKFEWDFDGNGVWDYTSSSTGVTTHVYDLAGTYNATVRVMDNDGDTASDSMTVTIRPANRAPRISEPSPSGSVSMDAESSKTFTIKVTDADGDPVTIKWAVDGRKQTSEGASFIYTPTELDVGAHEVRVTASDGEASDSHAWSVSVKAINHVPRIEDSSPSSRYLLMNEGETLQFSVDVSDEDGDDLEYRWTLDGLLVGSLAQYSYIADEDSMGMHTIKVTISDGKLDVFTNWTVEVLSLNNAPVIRFVTPSDGDRFDTKDNIFFEVDAYDPDGDTLSYTWSSNIDGQLGKQKSVTMQLSKGIHTITIKVMDSRGTLTEKNFVITVKKASSGTSTGGGSDAAGAIALLIVVVVLAVLGYLMIERRRKSMHTLAYQRRMYEEALEEEEGMEEERPVKRTPKRKVAPKKKVRKRRPRPMPMMEHAVDEEEEELEDMFGAGEEEELIEDDDAPEPEPRPSRPRKVVKKRVRR